MKRWYPWIKHFDPPKPPPRPGVEAQDSQAMGIETPNHVEPLADVDETVTMILDCGALEWLAWADNLIAERARLGWHFHYGSGGIHFSDTDLLQFSRALKWLHQRIASADERIRELESSAAIAGELRRLLKAVEASRT